MRPANEERIYIATSSVISWAHTQMYICMRPASGRGRYIVTSYARIRVWPYTQNDHRWQWSYSTWSDDMLAAAPHWFKNITGPILVKHMFAFFDIARIIFRSDAFSYVQRLEIQWCNVTTLSYLNYFWVIIKKTCSIHFSVISQKIITISISKIWPKVARSIIITSSWESKFM